MAASKLNTAKKPAKTVPGKNGQPVAAEPGDVLTLAEAAAYLRVAEADVLHAVRSQSLPGREVAGAWRFLRSSLQAWLNEPVKQYSKEAFLALSGVWKDDPYIDEMLKEIYKKRGRSMTEEEG